MSAVRFRLLPRQNLDQSQVDKQRAGFNKAMLITLFLLPGMTIFFLFLLMPVSQSVYFSTYKWNGLGPMTDYVGFDNYDKLLHQSAFQLSLGHSFVIMILSLFVQLP